MLEYATYYEIVGCPDYRVVSDGWYIQSRKNGRHGIKDRWKRVGALVQGYWNVALHTSEGCILNTSYHRVIAEIFYGPCPVDCEVRHGVGGQNDNSPENLSYGTPKENYQDKLRDGKGLSGERNNRAKLTELKVKEIHFLSEYASNLELSILYGVSKAQISNILSGRYWKHVKL